MFQEIATFSIPWHVLLVLMRKSWKVLVLGLGLAVSSCGVVKTMKQAQNKKDTGEEEPKKEVEAKPVRVVGEVTSVRSEEGFVLIRSYGGAKLNMGQMLTAVDHEGQTSSLKPTGERIGKFYAADVSGRFPAVGDLVLTRKLPDAGLQVSPETQ